MKVLLIFVLCTLVLLGHTVQYDVPDDPVLSKKEQRQLARQKRHAQQQAIHLVLKEQNRELIEKQRFVLEADYIQGHRGQRMYVSSKLNFVWVDSTEAILQIGTLSGLGYNGVGGITVDGSIRNFEVEEKTRKDKSSYTITFNINSSLGFYSVWLWVSETGQADARITGISSGSLTYLGEIIPLEKSKVYKAHSY